MELKDVKTQADYIQFQSEMLEEASQRELKYLNQIKKLLGLLVKSEETPLQTQDLVLEFDPYTKGYKLDNVNRVEVIDGFGRQYVNRSITSTQLSLQDDGKTLKIFVKSEN